MSTVKEIVNAVKGLPAAERADVRRKVEALINQPEQDQGDDDDRRRAAIDLDRRVQRALFEAGMLSEIKPPITDPTPYRREPITIKGRPLSETVIEERR
jgi:hypothetical protein